MLSNEYLSGVIDSQKGALLSQNPGIQRDGLSGVESFNSSGSGEQVKAPMSGNSFQADSPTHSCLIWKIPGCRVLNQRTSPDLIACFLDGQMNRWPLMKSRPLITGKLTSI